MEQLSNLELKRLLHILNNIMDTVIADDAGITWGLEDEVMEAQSMVKKALKTKNNNDNNSSNT